MARQSGLGRGLAALLPPAHLKAPIHQDVPSPASLPKEEADFMGEFSAELVKELASNQSGLQLIYRVLDGLVEQHQLHDAAIVLDEPGIGRQVFRAARRPIDDDNAELLTAEPGLYTEPELAESEIDVATLTSLCVVALRMELLKYDAWHDPLTGLYDRRSFDRLLEMAVARSTRYRWPFTLVLLDLDDFKGLNDQLGHAAGDTALRELAERFRRVLRFGDNAARIGGDEFALILPSTDPETVPPLLERIASSDGTISLPKFSYGLASCPNEADTFDALFKLADARLYEQKQNDHAAVALQ